MAITQRHVAAAPSRIQVRYRGLMSQASHISHMLRSHPNLHPAMSSGALKVSVRANGTIVSDTGAAGARSSALSLARTFLVSRGYSVSDIRGGMFRVGQRRAGHQDLIKNELLKVMSIAGPAVVVDNSGTPGLHTGNIPYTKDFPPEDIEVRVKPPTKKRTSAFATWLDTFVEEKGLNVDHVFTVQGPRWGDNLIPLSAVIESAKSTGDAEQRAIKDMLVKIDFRNGNVMHYFEHLAKALARNYG